MTLKNSNLSKEKKQDILKYVGIVALQILVAVLYSKTYRHLEVEKKKLSAKWQ